MNATCIFCSTSNNINTSLTVVVDGAKIQVNICDTHAESATIASAREAYLANKAKIDAFIAQAAAMGLTFVPAANGGISTPTLAAPPPPAPPAPKPPVPPPPAPDPAVPNPSPPPTRPAIPTPSTAPPISPIMEDDGDVVPTSKLERLMQSVGGSVENGGIRASVLAYQSHAITLASDREGHTLDPRVRDGKAKITMVEGRAGMPLAIPSMRVDGTGTTRIQLRRMSPSEFDRRAKNAADDSVRDRGTDYRNSYDTDTERTCPICGGAGTAVNMGRNITCPKCGGLGTIV